MAKNYMKITKSTFLILGQNIQWEDRDSKPIFGYWEVGDPLVLAETLFYEFLLIPSIRQMLMGLGHTPTHTPPGYTYPTTDHTHTTPIIKPLTISAN